MAQGVARNKEETIELLKPYFQMGCSVTKACNYGGISQSTVQTWIDADEELRLKITLWQNEPNVTARKNWLKKMEDGDYLASKEWISKKEKDEFSDRVENTGADGKDLPTPVLVEFISKPDGGENKDTDTRGV